MQMPSKFIIHPNRLIPNRLILDRPILDRLIPGTKTLVLNTHSLVSGINKFKRMLSIRTLIHIAIVLMVLISSRPVYSETITDSKGRKITFDTPFSRIISLYGAHTENLFYLECQKQLIGVSVNDTYPEAVHKKMKFSYHDGPEKFMAFKPDLVLIRPMIDNGYPKLINQLEKSGITVVSLQPASIDKMYNYWLILGKLTGHQDSARQMVQDFKKKIDTISQLTENITPKKRVYFEAIHTRMKTFTAKAMPIFALETAGGTNVADDAKASRNTNIAIYGKEQILAKALKIDVFLAQKGVMNAVTIDQIKKEPGFKVIKAVKLNQIYLIDENIVSRPVPRLVEGVITIGRLLYPDIFTKETL